MLDTLRLEANLDSVEVQILRDGTKAWDEYVLSHPEASNYHQVKWKTVIEQGFGHKTRYLQAKSGDRIVGILPLVVMKSLLFGRFLVSLPFFNYGGILADGQDAEEALLASAKEIALQERANHIELRHRTSHELGLQSKQQKVSMTLDLESDVDNQWNGLNAKVRNQIRKAEKSGLWIERGGLELLDDFYVVFARNMRDLGTPVYGITFFESILRNLPDSARIIIVRLAERPIAAGLLTGFKNTLEVPWAASLREHRTLCGNMLLYWEAIKFAITQGFKKFDLGRSTPGTGPYMFKAQWGACSEPLAWEYWTAAPGPLPDLSPRNPKYKLASRLWRLLPLPLTTFLGPSIVRQIP